MCPVICNTVFVFAINGHQRYWGMQKRIVCIRAYKLTPLYISPNACICYAYMASPHMRLGSYIRQVSILSQTLHFHRMFSE